MDSNANLSSVQFKSDEKPSILSWSNSGKGVMGESVNSGQSFPMIINRNWVTQKN
jgi:hypothetical protein